MSPAVPGTYDHCRVQYDHCIKNWPEACNGDYNPFCCRWPKSCSIPVLRTECTSCSSDYDGYFVCIDNMRHHPGEATPISRCDCICHSEKYYSW